MQNFENVPESHISLVKANLKAWNNFPTWVYYTKRPDSLLQGFHALDPEALMESSILSSWLSPKVEVVFIC